MDAEKLTFNASPLKDISGPDNLDQYNHKINKFLEQTALQQIAIKINNNIAYLTKRELQCLRMIPMGRTLKEIGNQLEISQRTVETHINAIKSKTGLVFKNELISLYEKSSLNLYRNF